MKIESLLILGASSDIGLELLRQLDGQVPLILAHANQGSERLRGHAAQAQSKLVCLQADLAEEAQVQRLIQEARAAVACPSAILHLAAPRLRLGRFKDATRDDFEENFQIQVQGPAQVLRHFLPAMAKAGHGRVLFLLSEITLVGVPSGMAPYATSKFALLGLNQSLAAEYSARGLDFGALSPGMADTAFLQHLHPSVAEAAAEASPGGRNLSAGEVAGRLGQLLLAPEKLDGGNFSMEGGAHGQH